MTWEVFYNLIGSVIALVQLQILAQKNTLKLNSPAHKLHNNFLNVTLDFIIIYWGYLI